MDPLTVLREFIIDKKLDDVTESEDGKRINFGDRYSFPKVSVVVITVVGFVVIGCDHMTVTPLICASLVL